MQHFIELLNNHLIETIFSVFGMIFSGIGAFIFHTARKFKSNIQREIREQELIKEAVLSMIQERLNTSCEYYLVRDQVTPVGLKSIIRMYKSYKALGGNGVMDEIINKVKRLPVKKQKNR